MRKIILLLSLALLSVFPAFSQTVYNVCRTNEDVNIYNLQADTYNVTNISDDSFNFTAMNQDYVVKKVPNTNFFYYATNDEIHQNDFFVYPVDDKSFFVVPYYTIAQSDQLELRYYHTDRKVAAEQDVNKRCAWETFKKAREIMASYLNQKRATDNKAYAERSKIVYTDFVKNYQSQRNDPALNKAILGWWLKVVPNAANAFPLLQIKIMQPSWVISRNEYGIVTHKMSSAMYIWKKKEDNTCYAEWQSFKYESLGGGTFDTELEHYSNRLNSGQFDFLEVPENRRMVSGTTYEIDCAPFPSVPLH